MTKTAEKAVAPICASFGHDRTRLLDILQTVQRQLGQVDEATIDVAAGNGGAIIAESEPGHGALFVITLPIP